MTIWQWLLFQWLCISNNYCRRHGVKLEWTPSCDNWCEQCANERKRKETETANTILLLFSKIGKR